MFQLTPDLDVSAELLPGIGSTSCFLSARYGQMLYLTLLVAPLLAANVLFFALSAWNLVYGVWANTRGSKAPHRASSARSQHEARYKIVIKMVFAMGIPWVAEEASYILNHFYGQDRFR